MNSAGSHTPKLRAGDLAQPVLAGILAALVGYVLLVAALPSVFVTPTMPILPAE